MNIEHKEVVKNPTSLKEARLRYKSEKCAEPNIRHKYSPQKENKGDGIDFDSISHYKGNATN
jgi:hypothetical protein